jgi:mycothiol synthase
VSLPPGFESRRATSADAARAAAVVRAFEEHETGAAETTVEDVTDWWRELDLATDVWLIDDATGAPAAYGAVFRDGESRMQADGYVIPSVRGCGIGRYLVGAMEGRAGAYGAAVLTNGVLASDVAAQSLLASAGYRAERRFARMVIEMESEPTPPASPPGIEVRPFRPGADDRAFHDVLNEAFAEHWGHAPETFERWREITMDSPRFDPSLWLVAEENGELIGIARCTWKVSDIGWVNDLGVRPSARRRGIALDLLTRAFGEFYARGERTVGLGVDTQNETGATRLYERAGMRAAYTAVIFEKRLS